MRLSWDVGCRYPQPVTPLWQGLRVTGNDCRRQMETMLALCVVCKVLCIPENFRAAVVKTIKRRLLHLEMFGSKMSCQTINTPWFFSLALFYLVISPFIERTEW